MYIRNSPRRQLAIFILQFCPIAWQTHILQHALWPIVLDVFCRPPKLAGETCDEYSGGRLLNPKFQEKKGSGAA